MRQQEKVWEKEQEGDIFYLMVQSTDTTTRRWGPGESRSRDCIKGCYMGLGTQALDPSPAASWGSISAELDQGWSVGLEGSMLTYESDVTSSGFLCNLPLKHNHHLWHLWHPWVLHQLCCSEQCTVPAGSYRSLCATAAAACQGACTLLCQFHCVVSDQTWQLGLLPKVLKLP